MYNWRRALYTFRTSPGPTHKMEDFKSTKSEQECLGRDFLRKTEGKGQMSYEYVATQRQAADNGLKAAAIPQRKHAVEDLTN